MGAATPPRLERRPAKAERPHMVGMTLRRPRRVPAGAMVKRAMDECPRILKSLVGRLIQEARLSAHPCVASKGLASRWLATPAAAPRCARPSWISSGSGDLMCASPLGGGTDTPLLSHTRAAQGILVAEGGGSLCYIEFMLDRRAGGP
jgi:hypothetical protein